MGRMGAEDPARVSRAVPLVDLKAQHAAIAAEVQAAIDNVMSNTDFILGADVAEFESEFARYCDAEHCVGLDSGMSALELGMRAMGIGPGDEVITPAGSFIASSSAISFTGARPVWVDVDPKTYNIDPALIEAAITPSTRAIMAVHLYGQPAEMDRILAIGRKHDLPVIEDACQSHGARYKGRRTGSMGAFGAFSFYPAKNLGAYGDAGALTTNDAGIAEKVRMMRNYGQREKYDHVYLAWNRRLDTIQAAVLRVKLRHLDRWNELRRTIASDAAAHIARGRARLPPLRRRGRGPRTRAGRACGARHIDRDPLPRADPPPGGVPRGRLRAGLVPRHRGRGQANPLAADVSRAHRGGSAPRRGRARPGRQRFSPSLSSSTGRKYPHQSTMGRARVYGFLPPA